MIYLGSKRRLASSIVPIIQDYIDKLGIDTYIELFGGGANIIDKVKCKNRIYMDANEDLVCLFNYIKSDLKISIAPDNCSVEHYQEVKKDKEYKTYSREYRTLIGYTATFGGKYFNGYARESTGKRNMYRERLTNLRNQAPLLTDIIFICNNYKDLDISKYNCCCFYLDPPYKGTTQYPLAPIDYDEFYSFCRELSKNNIVLISEYQMPIDFDCIWQKECKVSLKADRDKADVATEKLFVYNNMWNKDIVEVQKTYKIRSLF